MSRVGRIRKTEGATAAPKKIGGPSASVSASRWRTSTSVNRPEDGKRESGDETEEAIDASGPNPSFPTSSLPSAVYRLPSAVCRLAVSRLGGVLRGDGWHEPGAVRAVQEQLHGSTPFRSITACPFVDIHRNEPVRPGGVEAARIAHGVGERRFPVGQPVFDRAGKGAGDPRDAVRAEISPHDVAAERQGQPRLRLPPLPEVDDRRQAFFLERQLPLVD